MRVVVFSLVLFIGAPLVIGQVPPPRPEHFFHHVFAPHRNDGDSLPTRFKDLQCALVLIQADQRWGTGFFISADGDLATASHVVGNRQFSLTPEGQVRASLAIPATFSITDNAGNRTVISADKVEHNPDAWLSDVALVKTGIHPPCWLRQADDRALRTGEHVIAMGFPGLAFQALTIYTGIMSARLPSSGFPAAFIQVGPNPQNVGAIEAPNEVIRVQMPISPGLSGAPLIDDQNRVLGVISAAGGWTQDLEVLVGLLNSGQLRFLIPPPPPSYQNAPPNMVQVNLNDLMLTAELAGLFHDYASPGYGDAVPLRYLRKPSQRNRPPASHTH